jgi:hypothetical protein
VSAVEHFELLAIHHLGHTIGDRCNPVVEIHLAGGDPNVFGRHMVESAASGD